MPSSPFLPRCEFCACSSLEPCIDVRTGWKCEWVTEGICSACCSDVLDELEPSLIDLAWTVPVSAAYL